MRAPRPALALLLLASTAFAAGPLAKRDGSSRGDEPMHVHVAVPGDTLIGLGRRLLIDPAAWPELARLNRVRNPRRMAVGSALRIPLRLLRTEAASATVTAVSGAVRTGAATVTVGQTLAEGSEVSTGEGGQLSVRLVDGTLLRLRSLGRLRIDESRRVPATDSTRAGVQLDSGRLEVEARPARAGQPGFRVSTPQGVLGVRGTEFRVESTGTLTRGEVLQGVVAVTGAVLAAGTAALPAPAPEQRLQAGFGTVIDASGRVATATTLLPAPDLARLPTLHERPLVRLRLDALAGAQGYRVQVARDEGFDELLADVRSATPELRIAGLADGHYPMRLRAVDGHGLEGHDARSMLNLKAHPEPPLPRAPAPRAVIRGTRADFAWAASSEARRYRLQLARSDGDASGFAAPVRDILDLDALAFSVDGLAPGPYLWRLASVGADGDQGPFSDALGLELRALPAQPVAPAAPAVGDQGVRLYWQGLPGQRFDFQLARDAGFTQIVQQHALERAEIELPLPGSGRFHLRLRALDADGYAGPWSATQHFDVTPCVRDGRAACVRVEGGTLQLQ